MAAGKLITIYSLLLLLTGCVESRYEKYLTDSSLKEWFMSNADSLELLAGVVALSDISGTGISCSGLQELNGNSQAMELLEKYVNNIKGPIPKKCFQVSASRKEGALYALSINIINDGVCYYSDSCERI